MTVSVRKPEIRIGTTNMGEGLCMDAKLVNEQAGLQERLRLLCDVSQKIGTVPEVTDLMGQICQQAQRTLGASASSLLLVSEDRKELFFQVAKGKAGKALEQMRLNIDDGIAGWVARTGKPIGVNDVVMDSRFNRGVDKKVDFTTKSILSAPLKAKR